MSREAYQADCVGCLPVLVDMKTKKKLPNEHPCTAAVMALWAKLTDGQRQAWHAVTCLNSRDRYDLLAIDPFVKDMTAIVERHFGDQKSG